MLRLISQASQAKHKTCASHASLGIAKDQNDLGKEIWEQVHWNVRLSFHPWYCKQATESPRRNILLMKPQARMVSHKKHTRERERRWVTASLLPVAMPFAPSSFLLLVAMPGAPNSILAPSSDARVTQPLC